MYGVGGHAEIDEFPKQGRPPKVSILQPVSGQRNHKKFVSEFPGMRTEANHKKHNTCSR